MLTLCENCGNHYDDSIQSKKCAGIGAGSKVSSNTAAGSAHRNIRSNSAIEEHIEQTRAANRYHTPAVSADPRHSRSDVPRTDAAPSGDQSPA